MESACSVTTRKTLEAEHLFGEQLSDSLANAHVIGKSNANKKILTMSHLLPLEKSISDTLSKLFFVVTIFLLAACGSKKQILLTRNLSFEEKADLECFLQTLVFEHHGAFVLFGSKPICVMTLRDTDVKIDEAAFQQWFDSLSDEEKAQIEAVREQAEAIPELKRNPYQGWLALQKAQRNLGMKNYLFRVVPLRGQGRYELMLINIQQTALVLAEHYEIFKQASGGSDFHPLQAVFDLQDTDSLFWKQVFSKQNHLAKGLLFGFGLKNSLFGNWRFSSLNGGLDLPSEKYRREIEDYLKSSSSMASTLFCAAGESSVSEITIPLFGMVRGDGTVGEYAKEKDVIEKIYRGQDIAEVTLKCLAGL